MVTRFARVVALILVLVLCCGVPAPASASGEARPKSVQFVVGQSVYVVDGIVHIMDAVPFVQDNRTLVPVRYLALALGIPESAITWDDQAQAVTLAGAGVTLRLVIGQKVMLANEKPVAMDVAPLVRDGRTYVPARYVAEAFGYDVGWNEATQTVVVTLAGEGPASGRQLTDLAALLREQVVLVCVFDGAGKQVSLGSGIAVARDLVLTNLHVVRGGARVVVVSAQDQELVVEGAVGWDEVNDLVVVKVKGELTPAEVGDSDSVKVGQRVVAVGNPFGLRATVSEGIVSGLRDVGGRRLIQTTAPISPGSSGGGLFDLDGRLVGVTTSFVEGGQNLNLAVPVNAAKKLLDAPGTVRPLPGAPQEAPPGAEEEKQVTEAALVAFLNREYSRFKTQGGEILFYWMEWQNPSGRYDLEAWGRIVPSTYLTWLLMEQGARMGVMKQIAQALDEFCPGQTFSVIVFYQDYWSTYPWSFDPDEVVLSVDGKSWLVTHIIGSAYGDEEKIGWFAQP